MTAPTAPRVVLVRPKYEGNVGASARAMGNMGLSDLRIVAPAEEEEALTGASREAWSLAASGRGILTSAQVHPTLAEAVEGCTVVVACTARPRRWKAWSVLGPGPSAELMSERIDAGEEVALVFGPEDHGLSTEDLELATHLCNIPTGGEVSSLNLAQAVLLLGWEWGKAAEALRRRPSKRSGKRARATVEQIDALAEKAGDLLGRIDFFRRRPREQTLTMLKQVLVRGEMTEVETHFLFGIVGKLRWHLEHPGHLVPLEGGGDGADAGDDDANLDEDA